MALVKRTILCVVIAALSLEAPGDEPVEWLSDLTGPESSSSFQVSEGSSDTITTSQAARRRRRRRRKGGRVLWSWMLSTKFLQEPLNLTSTSVQDVEVLASHVGVCVGGAMYYFINRYLAFKFDLCGYAGVSQATASTVASLLAIDYSARNVPVFGIWSGPALQIGPKPRGVFMEVGVPVGIRYGLWPQPPDSGFALEDGFAVFPAVMLGSGLRTRHYWMSVRFGFYRGFGNLKAEIVQEIRF
jgi:hypothetical protein